jgi:hypothetical protein
MKFLLSLLADSDHSSISCLVILRLRLGCISPNFPPAQLLPTSAYSSTLKTKAVSSSETLACLRTTRRYSSEYRALCNEPRLLWCPRLYSRYIRVVISLFATYLTTLFSQTDTGILRLWDIFLPYFLQLIIPNNTLSFWALHYERLEALLSILTRAGAYVQKNVACYRVPEKIIRVFEGSGRFLVA